MHAQLVLFDGFDPLDVIGPFEVLAAGGDAVDGDLIVELVSAEGPRPVVSGTLGLTLQATAQLDPSKPGYVIVPGASGPIEGDPDEIDTIPVLLARFGETEAAPLMRKAMANPTSRWRPSAVDHSHWRWRGFSRVGTQSRTTSAWTCWKRPASTSSMRGWSTTAIL